jgi:hypothetical protein
MSFIDDNTIEALRSFGTEELPSYERALRGACNSTPPPFGQAWYGEKYRLLASDPAWLASSLIANAEKEGDGARKLWQLAASTPDPEIGEAVRLHAVDESRHALLYLAMCELVFPGAMDETLKAYADGISPRYSARDELPALPRVTSERVLDDLVQMNIGEIRTRIHQLLLRPVISAFCPEASADRLGRVLDSLLEDETRHIQYTARLIEAAANRGQDDFVLATMERRLREFNEITMNEVGEARFVGE